MMNEMVERVAKAIAAADGYDSWETAHKLTIDKYTGLARAGINAMRDPPAAVIEAHHVVPDDTDFPERAKRNWQAMIDAALGREA